MFMGITERLPDTPRSRLLGTLGGIDKVMWMAIPVISALVVLLFLWSSIEEAWTLRRFPKDVFPFLMASSAVFIVVVLTFF
jgi:hypothetical protein